MLYILSYESGILSGLVLLEVRNKICWHGDLIML